MKKTRFSMSIILVLMMLALLSYSTLAGDDAINASLLWLNPASGTMPVGDTSNVVIQLDDVTNVYAAEMNLDFDHNILAVVDADSGKEGVQITTGVCPSPDFVVRNKADNTAGTIEYALTQLFPTPACDGGEVATVEFECLSAGTSPVTITHSLLSDSNGFTIDVDATEGGMVECSSVSVNKPPNKPNEPAPADMATGVSITTDLSWEGGDPDPGDTVTYDVFFGTSSPPTTLLCDDAAVETCDPGTLNYSTSYYWKVIATDNHGLPTPGDVWQFTTETEPTTEPNKPPNKPSDPTPADIATGVSITTDLSWMGGDPDPGDIVTYDVLFGTSSPPTTLLCDDAAATTCNPGTLDYDTTYYWQVTATDDSGLSTPGDEWRFTTEAEEEPPGNRLFLPIVLNNRTIGR